MWVGYIEFCRSSERSAAGEQICRKAQLAPRDLRGCPYALVGEPADIIDQLAERKEVLGLDAVIVGLTPSLDRFVHDVMPHV
jgi:alkanesulfonate monooxygenase SsuD/methylene tetrahydromethanopterin reductase-like flavin-dependent oxidoreductase (luciferase family)